MKICRKEVFGRAFCKYLRMAFPTSGSSGRYEVDPVLARCAECIPPEWYDYDHQGLERLVETLYDRRLKIRDLILGFRDSTRQPFPNWKQSIQIFVPSSVLDEPSSSNSESVGSAQLPRSFTPRDREDRHDPAKTANAVIIQAH